MATLYELLTAAGLPIDSASLEDGVRLLPGTSLTAEQALLLGEIVLQFQDPAGYAAYVLQNDTIANAVIRFNQLPDWSTWTYAEARDGVRSRIFNGWDQAQVDAYIDGLPKTIPGMITGMKQIGTAILAIRTILEAMAQAIVFLRDLVVRFRG